jgi:sensor histidine kinase YesM
MDGKTLDNLNQAESPASAENGAKTGGARVGIANIRERLGIQFNGRAALVFESIAGKGARARLVFPAA